MRAKQAASSTRSLRHLEIDPVNREALGCLLHNDRVERVPLGKLVAVLRTLG